MKDTWMKKSLVVSVILLFLGVTVAPSINFTVVKASNDNDLVEVTTEACGINGFGNTTVKLTRQQYQNLEQYLVDFRSRLNKTSTREEAVPIFKDAVVELNKYGLLPKRMSVEQAQRVITGKYQNKNIIKLQEKLLRSRLLTQDNIGNYFCLITGQTTNTLIQPLLNYIVMIPLVPVAMLIIFLLIKYLFQEPPPIINLFLPLFICYFLYEQFSWERQKILVGANLWLVNSSGWIDTIGITGKQSINGSIIGQIPIHGFLSELIKTIIEVFYAPPLDVKKITRGAIGFTGLRLCLNQTSYESYYLGSALWVEIGSEPPL